MERQSNGELRDSIADLAARIRESRIERGLSPEAPVIVRDLPDTTALTLMDSLDSFVEVCVEIARLYRGGHFVVIDMERLKQYRESANSLGRSRGFEGWGTGLKVHLIMARISGINRQITEGASPDELSQHETVGAFYEAVMAFKNDLPLSKGGYRYFMKRSSGHEEF